MRYSLKHHLRRLAVATAVAMAASTVMAPPAHAAGSVIDIGSTIRSGNLVKGSGSWTNNGDWTSACVRIMLQYTSELGQPKKQLSIACRTGTGSATWSAPDVPWVDAPWNTCIRYYTTITAYLNGVSKTSKTSNSLYDCTPG